MHVYKGYASTDSIKVLNSFNFELQLKDNEFAIRNELLIDLLTGLKYQITKIIKRYKKKF